MKKSIALILAAVIVVSISFAACSSKKGNKESIATISGADASQEGLAGAETEYGTEINEEGKEVDVVYETDKDGNKKAYELDENGNKKKNKNGDYITVKVSENTDNKKNKKTTAAKTTKKSTTTKKAETTKENPTGTTNKNDETTKKELTTIDPSKDKVPLTSESGTVVSFTLQDQQIIADMLEVPGLTAYSYENSSGVKPGLAVHAAIWMAQRQGASGTTYPSGTVVLDLFKYFGQTVVNFKTNCNNAATAENAPIKYSGKTDTFEITNAETKKQTVKISQIEYLGNNNYYKITGSVTGVKGVSSVIAIVQKNKLDTSLGFSVKALKWS